MPRKGLFWEQIPIHCIGNDFRDIDDNDSDEDIMLVYNDLELMPW